MPTKNTTVTNEYQSEHVPKTRSKAWGVLGAGFFVFLALMGVFAKLAEETHEGDTLPFDQAILYVVHAMRTSLLDTFVPIVTNLGGVIGVVTIVLLASVLLASRRKYLALVQVLAGVGGAVALNLVVKTFFARPRPDLLERLVTETSYSFPSGHSMVSAALALSLVLIAWKTRWRWWVVAGAVAYVALIGLTRLYLGVHYPTDVLAGWTLGGAWVLLVALAIGGIKAKRGAR